MKAIGKILLAFAIGGALIGYRFYSRNQLKQEVLGQLVGICEGEQPCEAAVSSFYEDCFSKNSSLGSRRRGPSINESGLVACINQASGTEWFAVGE